MSGVNETCGASYYTKVSTQLDWIKKNSRDYPSCIPGDDTPNPPPPVTTPPPFKPSPTENCKLNLSLQI